MTKLSNNADHANAAHNGTVDDDRLIVRLETYRDELMWAVDVQKVWGRTVQTNVVMRFSNLAAVRVAGAEAIAELTRQWDTPAVYVLGTPDHVASTDVLTDYIDGALGCTERER